MEKCEYCGKEFSLLSNRQRKRIAMFKETHECGIICDPCISQVTQAEFKAAIIEKLKTMQENTKQEVNEIVAEAIQEV